MRLKNSIGVTVAVVSLGSFLLRLPLCLVGPGFDYDSALFLHHAILSVRLRDYVPSRAPGYIVPDHLGHLLAPYGWVYLCLLCSFLHSVTIPIFAKILKHLGVSQGSLTYSIIFYGFLPIHLLAYSDVMVEYPLMMLGILLGWLCLIREKLIPSALLLGIGASMRPSQGVFIALIFIVFVAYRFGWRSLIPYSSMLLAPILLLWVLPGIWLEGHSFIFEYRPYSSDLLGYLRHLMLRFVAPFGIVPLTLVSMGILFSARKITGLARKEPHLTLSIILVIVVSILFFRHPFKTNYLLLSIPFLIYTMSVFFQNKLFKAIVFASVLHGLVALPSIPPCESAAVLGVGTIIADYRDRANSLQESEYLFKNTPPKSIVLCNARIIHLESYDILRNKKANYRTSSGVIRDEENDRWWYMATHEQIVRIKEESTNYRVFATESIYRRFQKFFENLGFLNRVSRLDTSRCM